METIEKIQSIAIQLQNSEYGDLNWFEALRIAIEIEKTDVLKSTLLAGISGEPHPLEAIAIQLGYGEGRPTIPDCLNDITITLKADV